MQGQERTVLGRQSPFLRLLWRVLWQLHKSAPQGQEDVPCKRRISHQMLCALWVLGLEIENAFLLRPGWTAVQMSGIRSWSLQQRGLPWAVDKHIEAYVGARDCPQGKIASLFMGTWAPNITKCFSLWGCFQEAGESEMSSVWRVYSGELLQ